MNSETNIAIVRRYYEEAVNQGKLEVVDELFAPDFAGFKVEGVRGGASAQDFKNIIVAIRQAFPDYVHHVDEYIAAGDKVITRGTTTGTHLGNTYANIPATGKRTKGTVMEIWRLEEGKIVENWFDADTFSGLAHLGVLPAWDQLAHAKWTVEGELSQTERNKATVRRLMDATNRQDAAVFDEIMSPELAAGMKQGLQWVYATFEGHCVEITDMIAEGDQVWVRIRTSGRHTGEWEGVPPTGKRWTNVGVEHYRFAEGRIVEVASLFDELGHLKQLGATIQSPAQRASEGIELIKR